MSKLNQAEARIENLLETVRTLKCAMGLMEYWEDTMPARLIQIASDAIHEEERMRQIDEVASL